MVAAVVVFVVGNPSRGDDALGPALLASVAEELPPDVEVIEDFQLQIEHALDLQQRQLALFIDAGELTPAPFVFYETQPRRDPTLSSHAMSPEAVLQVFKDVQAGVPPPAFVLGIRGESFDLGAALSPAAQGYLQQAQQHLLACLARPEPAYWRSLVKPPLKI